MTPGFQRTLVFCLLGLALTMRGFAAETNKMNVLFIISDDMRAELGCHGSKLVSTPNLDRLEAQGFENCAKLHASAGLLWPGRPHSACCRMP